MFEFEYTGDAFVDTGGVVLEYFQENFPEKSLRDILELVSRIYVQNWDKKLHSFFLNHIITQPAYSKLTNIELINKVVDLYINEPSKTGKYGFCRICGKESALYPSSRATGFVCGSGTLLNYHHCFEQGLMICSECLIKLFLVPLAVYQGYNIILIQPNSKAVIKYIKRNIIDINCNKYLANDNHGGVLTYRTPKRENALYLIANELIDLFLNEIDTEEHITIWEFSNYATSPEMNIINLPSKVFIFLAEMAKMDIKKLWNQFVYKYYKNQKIKYDEWKDSFVDKKGEKVEAEVIEREYNYIISKLVSEISILSDIKKYNKSMLAIKKDHLHWKIIEMYTMEVLSMQKETLNILKKVCENIFDFMLKNDADKKIISKIELARKPNDLRLELLRLIKKNYHTGTEKPLITLEEYVNYLFPDGQHWSEIRDLMLIYLYELLHKNKIKIEMENTEVTETIDDDTSENPTTLY